ncbi:MAG TPA: RHS repeat-associated core domain-containing protein [Anaerolineae bacterium]|nr:RHS repeat-associated core domain-containing protein [Anaerolineae bacterium]
MVHLSKLSRFIICLFLMLFLFTVQASSQAAFADFSSNKDVGLRSNPHNMAFQPRAQANDLNEFVPPQVAHINQTTKLNTPVTTAILSAKGQAVSFANNRVMVVADEQTFAGPTQLEFMELPSLTKNIRTEGVNGNALEIQHLIRFNVEGIEHRNGRAWEEFDSPARLVVDLREFGFDLDKLGGTFFLAYEDETNPGQWLEVPTTIHQKTGLISAEVMHFSSWTTGWRPEGWTMQWETPTASGFTGAATYGKGLQLPVGRAGLQPSVSFSYSNSAMNGAQRFVAQGDIASGWSLNQIAIIRTGVEMSDGITAMEYPDTFRLVLNGSGYKLESSSDPYYGGTRYYVKDAPQILVVKYNNYWAVHTGEGTLYRLGYTADSRTEHKFVLNEHLDTDGDPNSHATHDNAIIEWHVDTITDAFGNQILYQYDNSDVVDSQQFVVTCPWSGFCDIRMRTFGSQVEEIYYNFSTRINTDIVPALHTVPRLNINDAATKIDFDYTAYNGTRLHKVYIYHNNDTTPIREYEITAQNIAVENAGCQNGSNIRYSTTRVVNSITEYAFDPLTNGWVSLPSVTFEYTDKANYSDNGNNCFIFKHLSKVHNGYGGETEFAYGHDGRVIGSYVNTDSGPTSYPDMVRSYYVNDIYNRDGLGQTSRIQFTRTGRCYNQTEGSYGPQCQTDDDAPEYSTLSGFADVTTKYYVGSSVYKQTYTHYLQDADRFGRPDIERELNGSGQILSQKNTSYQTIIYANTTNFTTVANETSYQYDVVNGTSISSRKEYSYLTSYQGGTQYGNLTHIRTFDAASNGNLVRETANFYYPNDSDNYWQVTQLGGQVVYDPNGNIINGQWIHYDGATTSEAPPTQGFPTRTRKFATIECTDLSADPVTNCANAYQTIEKELTKDAYGNLKSATSYAGHGERAFDSNWIDVVNNPGTDPQTTTFWYDQGYNLYQVAMENPANEMITFGVYGFHVHPTNMFNQNYIEPVDGFQSQPGLLKWVSYPGRPDNRQKVYEYDPFGRLVNEYEASDNGHGNTNPWDGNPIQQIKYYDADWSTLTNQIDPANGQPFKITSTSRPANATLGQTATRYHDGLGRTIQTQVHGAFIGNSTGTENLKDIVTTMSYDEFGRIDCQTLPFAVNATSNYVSDGCTAHPHTTTSYDAQGRKVTITKADSSTINYDYTIVQNTFVDNQPGHHVTRITDANGNLREQYTNVLGQVSMIREFESGTGYADTRYYYDDLNNVTDVKTSVVLSANPTISETDRHMSVAYDNFGRKVSLTDPDLGTQLYHYNALGSIIWQIANETQANEKHVICFTYDNLNRVTSKRSGTGNSTQADPCSSGSDLAIYNYYTIGSGIGKLSEIQWPDNANRDAFTYDGRGRLETRTRYIDGNAFSATYSAYDQFDRPTQVVYQGSNGSETLTFGYDREGTNSLIANDGTTITNLVQNIAYNAQGQMTYLDREATSNAPDTSYTYFSQYDVAGGGDGDSNFRLQTIDHGLITFDYEYDLVGNISEINSGSDVQTFAYDDLYRLKNVSGDFSQVYEYNRLGNMTKRGIQEYEYHPTKIHAVTSIGTTDSFGYDSHGNMTTRTQSGVTYAQAFDVENRLTSVTKGNETTHFAYDFDGNRVKTVKPNGVIIYTPFPEYEEEWWPSTSSAPSVTFTANGTTELTISPNVGFALDWNSNGILCEASGSWSGDKETSGTQLMSGFSSGSRTYTLTCWNSTGSTTQNVTVTIQQSPPPTLTFTANGQTITYVSAGKAFGLSWSATNAMGNCIASGYWSGSKATSGNELMPGFKSGSRNYTLTCSNMNGSTSKTVTVIIGSGCDPMYCLSGGDEPTFVKDGENQPLINNKETTTFKGTTTSLTQQVITRITYHFAGQAIATKVMNHPISSENGLYYMLSDHLGSASAMSDAAGNQVGTITRYTPFGEYRTGGSNDITDLGYTGQRENMDLGLYYYNARYYIPGIARFASADSIIPDINNPQSLNRYSYVINNPIIYNDPSGHHYDIGEVSYRYTGNKYYDAGCDCMVYGNEKYGRDTEQVPGYVPAQTEAVAIEKIEAEGKEDLYVIPTFAELYETNEDFQDIIDNHMQCMGLGLCSVQDTNDYVRQRETEWTANYILCISDAASMCSFEHTYAELVNDLGHEPETLWELFTEMSERMLADGYDPFASEGIGIGDFDGLNGFSASFSDSLGKALDPILSTLFEEIRPATKDVDIASDIKK